MIASQTASRGPAIRELTEPETRGVAGGLAIATSCKSPTDIKIPILKPDLTVGYIIIRICH